ESEGVVGTGNVDLLRPDARIGPQDFAGVSAGHRGYGAALVVHVDARFHTRPATPRMRTSGLAQSPARSRPVTTIAVALSVSTQQSSRCSGLQIVRLASTSSTLTRCL